MTRGCDDSSDEGAVPEPPFNRERFLEWRAPRRGSSNPERLTNPVWQWLVQSRINAYQANERFSGPSALQAGPGWCFDRFGQTTNRLADGRVVFVAGEHEDYYDADFFIYNDVVVCDPDGALEIFCYPSEIFPPTDFHTASLVGEELILIGNLGYQQDRRPGFTQVLRLDSQSFAVSAVSTSGDAPGWIHGHNIQLEENGNSLILKGGKLDHGGSLVENIDDWRLDTQSWCWERLTNRNWPRWEFARSDGCKNHLWEIRRAYWSRSVGWKKEWGEQMGELKKRLGMRPDLDLVDTLFCPPVSHEVLPQGEDEYNVFRVRVAGVVVRVVEERWGVQMTVEGTLDPDVLALLTEDLRGKLSKLEGMEFRVRRLCL